MGTITVNVADDVEHVFREEVKEHYGKGKGILGQAVKEAFMEWVKKKKQEDSVNTLKAMLGKFEGGRILYKKREELYDRNRPY